MSHPPNRPIRSLYCASSFSALYCASFSTVHHLVHCTVHHLVHCTVHHSPAYTQVQCCLTSHAPEPTCTVPLTLVPNCTISLLCITPSFRVSRFILVTCADCALACRLLISHCFSHINQLNKQRTAAMAANKEEQSTLAEQQRTTRQEVCCRRFTTALS